MKKFLSVFLAAFMLLSLCACGTQKAEKTMRTFCDGMKEYDFEKMQACLVPSAGSIQAKIGEMEGGEEAAALLYAKMKEWAAKMTYEIVSVNEEGDHATATVKYYYVDASPILQDVLGEYLGQAFASVFSGISEDDLRAMAEQILNDKMETAQTGSAQMSVTYDLVKSGKEWKITEVPKDSLQVLTANFVKSITDLASVFGKTG